MSVIDNAIKQLWKDGIKIVKLWENASPTSQFADQTLQINTANYQMILITFRGSSGSTGNANGGSALIGIIGEVAQIVTENSARITRRSAYWINTSEIQIADCQTIVTYNNAGARTTENQRSIPVAIYGIKFLIGGGIE